MFESTGCAAVMLARGALGNPWLFAQVLGTRDSEPTREEILAEWRWVLERAVEHLGPERAARYLRKFHPWYVERLGEGKALQAALQQADSIAEQRAVIDGIAATSGCIEPLLPCAAVRPARSGPCVFQDPTSQGRRMQKDVILTPEGLEKLKQEIEHLATTRRREVAERIKEAREFGDISENSEYDDAKNEQAMLEQRIAQLEDKLRSAQVINASELDNNVVRVGSLVAGKDDKGKSFEYAIVGSTEADPANKRLSNESPVGKALIGRKKGDTVSVPAPKGERKLTIGKISVA